MLVKISCDGNKPLKQEFDHNSTLGDLDNFILTKFSVPPYQSEITTGFPPTKLVRSDTKILLKQLGISSGSVISVHVNKQKAEFLEALKNMGFADDICMDALMESDNFDSLVELCIDKANNEPELSFSAVRRVIASDNSCLFNAVGSLFTHDSKDFNPMEYRDVIAETVTNNEFYTEEMLEKSPTDYAKWIVDSSKWGGEIEIIILSDHLKVEIAVADIRTMHILVYGVGKGYDKRIYLLYDGIHYDGIVQKQEENVNEIFSPSDVSFYEEVKEFIKYLNKKKKFVNIEGCGLQCNICFLAFKGQKEAVTHAKITGHQNFGQINS